MIYRPAYTTELAWLDRVEKTINGLRDPQQLSPDQYQQQLDMLMSEYAQLQERTEAIEHVNHEGGKFIREAKVGIIVNVPLMLLFKTHDVRLNTYVDTLEGVHGPGFSIQLHRTKPPPEPGHERVRRELDELNRRFSHLASIILERKNILQVLMQNWKRQQMVSVLLFLHDFTKIFAFCKNTKENCSRATDICTLANTV
jgi:hypothetical protein